MNDNISINKLQTFMAIIGCELWEVEGLGTFPPVLTVKANEMFHPIIGEFLKLKLLAPYGYRLVPYSEPLRATMNRINERRECNDSQNVHHPNCPAA